MRLLPFLCVALMFYAPMAYAQQSCLNADVDEAVKALMQKSAPDSARAKATKQVEFGIAKGVIKAESKADLVEVVVEYSVRKNAKCAIPPELKTRVSRSLAIIKGGGAHCEDGQFAKIIDRQFTALKESAGFDIFQAVIKEQVSSNVIPSVQEIFVTKWDGNEGFRERVIKTGLELNVMFTNKCTNLADPILDIVAEF